MFNCPQESIIAKSQLIPNMQMTVFLVILLTVLTCNQPDALAVENYNTLLSRATNLLTNGQPQQAVVLLQKAKTLRPKNAQAQATLGWAYYQLGNVDAAYKEAKGAVKLNYKNAYAHQCLVLLCLAKNMPSEAIKEMKILHKLNPNQKCNCPMDSLLRMNRPKRSNRKFQ